LDLKMKEYYNNNMTQLLNAMVKTNVALNKAKNLAGDESPEIRKAFRQLAIAHAVLFKAVAKTVRPVAARAVVAAKNRVSHIHARARRNLPPIMRAGAKHVRAGAGHVATRTKNRVGPMINTGMKRVRNSVGYFVKRAKSIF